MIGRSTVVALAAAALGLGVVGCATSSSSDMASSTFHPTWDHNEWASTGSSTVGDDQAATDTTGVGTGMTESTSIELPGTTRENAGTGAIGGGPAPESTDGSKPIEQRGHLDGTAGEQIGTPGMDRTGAKK